MSLVADVLMLTGSRHVLVVHSHDGLDEISVSAPTDVIEIKDGRSQNYVIDPSLAGLDISPVEALTSENIDTSVSILNYILTGKEKRLS